MLNEVLSRGHKTARIASDGLENAALVNRLNNHFISIGENRSNEIRQPVGATFRQYLQSNYLNSSFLHLPADRNEFSKIIRDMKSFHTAGADEICSKIFKAIVNEIVEPLVYSISLSLLCAVVPKMTKIAKIVPIYTSADKNIHTDLPISVLPTLSKKLEKIVSS